VDGSHLTLGWSDVERPTLFYMFLHEMVCKWAPSLDNSAQEGSLGFNRRLLIYGRDSLFTNSNTKTARHYSGIRLASVSCGLREAILLTTTCFNDERASA